jgi:hypothetical protein
VKYAACTGINLLSWDYPNENSLHHLIEKYQTYPITVLTRLAQNQKQVLLNSGVILCSDILKNPQVLREQGLNNTKIDAVVGEAQLLCGSKA